MRLKNKKGQSTVEYVLLVTAVLAVIIAFTANQKSGGFQYTLNQALGSATEQITNMQDRLDASHKASAPQTDTTGQIPPYTVNVDAGV